MFNKFEPLSDHHPELVAQIERVVHRAGMDIPPERMFEMKASEKWTTLNAYVTGFGATKRVVVWDTTMQPDDHAGDARWSSDTRWATTSSATFPRKSRSISSCSCCCCTSAIGWRTGCSRATARRWGIRDLADWASLPLLALILSVLTFLATPVFNAVSRHYEHQADQYGLEVVHGLMPDAPHGRCARFQVLGELSLDYPVRRTSFWSSGPGTIPPFATA